MSAIPSSPREGRGGESRRSTSSRSPSSGHPSRLATALLVAIALLGSLAHWASRRDGHDWGDDFSQYLTHAQALIDGPPYADTGNIANPDRTIGPATYPPVFPILLTGPLLLVGPEIEAIQPFFVIPLSLFFLAWALWLRSHSDVRWSAVAMLGVVANSYLWYFKDNILSELPFMTFMMVAFLLMRRLESQPSLVLEFALALAMALCYGTRFVGILLLPAFLLNELWQHRRLSARALRISAIVLLLAWGQGVWVGTVGAYGDTVSENLLADFPRGLLEVLETNTVIIPESLSAFLGSGLPVPYRSLTLSASLVLVGIGIFRRVASGPGVEDFWVLFIFALTCLSPWADPRLLLPILPFLVFYFCEGLKGCSEALAGGGRRVFLLTAGLLVAACYVVDYRDLATLTVTEGPHRPAARAMFEYVKEEVPSGDVCVFIKPRALSYFTGHRAAVYGETSVRDAAFFREIGANCFVRSLRTDEPRFADFLESFHGLEVVYRNPEFIVYRGQPTFPG